ncbi:unnamed protein product [Brassicogethes aeneus]|uniref:Anamorsin homolog n=1 Tax=Brassicogethes aeneus TaxID=1431903 RepID=A0A9P0FQJ7_BRAAE|nr:unnamed protein product [Brassicogethes aeneus]
MENIANLDKSVVTLIVGDKNEQIENEVKNNEKWKFCAQSEVSTIKNDSFNTILTLVKDDLLSKEVVRKLLEILTPEGKLLLKNVANTSEVEFLLKTNGFTQVTTDNDDITSQKPKYSLGSSASLNLKKTAPKTWKLNDVDDNDDETIDPDNLLDDEDLKKPDFSSLRVCGTTGQRKACKDCSCGLAEELSSETKKDNADLPKSSCGSCYLGDAFRCASCPYLGMPAFKPGEKIQLSGNQLQGDL